MAKRVRVGDFVLGQSLGAGTFSQVRMAEHVLTGEQRAVKIIEKSMFHKEAADIVRKEVRAMTQLRHPNVLRIETVLASSRNLYLVLPLMSGGDLFGLLRREKRLLESRARELVLQLIDAVAYCHSQGYAHRDIKPENLLIDDSGGLVVADFGLSHLTEEHSSAHLLQTRCGTLSYLAPEVISGYKGYDGTKVDVWGIGVTLFVLVAGSLPFGDCQDLTTIRKIIHFGPLYPYWFSEELKDLLDLMLEKNPVNRPSLDEVLQQNWFACI